MSTASWVARVGDRVAPIKTLADLRALIARTAGEARQELWLESPESSSICLLRSGDRALLLYLPAPGEVGFTSRSPEPIADAREAVEFTLANGQVDRYPAAWTVSAERAREALEEFWRTSEMPRCIRWNDEDAGQ